MGGFIAHPLPPCDDSNGERRFCCEEMKTASRPINIREITKRCLGDITVSLTAADAMWTLQ